MVYRFVILQGGGIREGMLELQARAAGRVDAELDLVPPAIGASGGVVAVHAGAAELGRIGEILGVEGDHQQR